MTTTERGTFAEAQGQDLVRTHDNGAVFTDGLTGNRRQQLRAAEQRVAWCATDNLNLSRTDARSHASAAAKAFALGESYRMGPYTFELRRRQA